MPIFIVDSNFFISAHRTTYPLDVAHSFWNKVKQLAEESKIISIDKVKNEIYPSEDELSLWCKENLPTDFFKASDTSDVISKYQDLVDWVETQRNLYLENAINQFLDANQADAFIVAFACTNSDYKITTQEISQPQRKNKIKIPEPCNALGIPFCNTIEMFRQLEETF